MKYKCPECEKIVDYGAEKPSDGNTFCAETDRVVQMIPVDESEE